MDWKTIDSAPKDEAILVYNPYFGVYSSQYTVVREDLGPDDRRTTSERPVRWEGFPLGLTSVGLGSWFPAATHWKPLPDGPEAVRAQP